MLGALRRAIDPGLALGSILARWPMISQGLAEGARRRRPQTSPVATYPQTS